MSEAASKAAVEATYRTGVDVVVVSYRTPGDLRDFLVSFAEAGTYDAALRVVNVCPQDEDERVVDRYAGALPESTVYWPTTENIGYNRAVNTAGGAGDREFVAVFNADVVLAPNSINELVGALRDHDDWGIVGPRQVDDAGRLTASGIFGTNDQPAWRCWREPGQDGRFSDVRDDCVVVLGSAFVIRRSLWDHLTACPLFRDVAPDARGPMLPAEGYYGETYLNYHAAAHGQLLAYLGTTTIKHRWHRASRIGGHHERHREVDHAYFGRACDAHGITHD